MFIVDPINLKRRLFLDKLMKKGLCHLNQLEQKLNIPKGVLRAAYDHECPLPIKYHQRVARFFFMNEKDLSDILSINVVKITTELKSTKDLRESTDI